jgi:hypothetical protein
MVHSLIEVAGSTIRMTVDDPELPVKLFQSGHSPQQLTLRKLPFVTPSRCGRLSGGFEVGPAVSEGRRRSATGQDLTVTGNTSKPTVAKPRGTIRRR